ncbi:MAG: dephospho-CoA kinase [Oxalobacteraceae bacterium]
MTAKAFKRFSVGLTGGIGSGKSAVAELLAQQGAAIIDTDQIAHALTAPGGAAMTPIAEQFGDSFLTPEGALNRAAMRERVFSDAGAKQQLEAILHPLIRQQTQIDAEQAIGPYLVFVVPLLVESGRWKDSVDRVLVVDCNEALQLERVMRRSQLTAEQVRAIMATQASREARLAVADDVIVNDQAPEALEQSVAALHQRYLALAERSTSVSERKTERF